MEELDKTIVAPKLLASIREDVDIKENDGSVSISMDVSPVFSYALCMNKTHLIKELSVENTLDKDIYDLRIKIKADNDLIEPYIEDIFILNAGQTYKTRPKLFVHPTKLLEMNEMTECLLKFTVMYKDKEVAVRYDRIQVLAYSEIPESYVGDSRILAAFVLPNNPAVEIIRQEATEYLKREDFNGDPSFSGYQGSAECVPKRVQNMAAALFYAIRKKNIVYSEPPASYEDEINGNRLIMQKVRFPDEILNTRFGTCMDMTLLYAACLEMPMIQLGGTRA
ncbi:hypothetical protein SAMN05216413_1609 [Ruminococcaceae bacterium KH2T8]|nr:hypothetical protein SAMN05216413_1609 [Ruminococcaceae bacterium KH2T8]